MCYSEISIHVIMRIIISYPLTHHNPISQWCNALVAAVDWLFQNSPCQSTFRLKDHLYIRFQYLVDAFTSDLTTKVNNSVRFALSVRSQFCPKRASLLAAGE